MLSLTLHIAFLSVWAASLVYFPFLFLERSSTESDERDNRLILLQRWIYAKIMTTSALATIAAGTWLVFERGFSGGWLHVKLALVLLLVLFHVYCGHLMFDRRRGRIRRPLFYALLSLVPVTAILAVLILVAGKPL